MDGYTEKDIDFLLSDRDVFNNFVYTPFREAIREIHERWKDDELKRSVENFLDGDVPEPLVNGSGAVIFRQLATPNYELRRFFAIPDALDLRPVFWEYHDDKFTSNNPLKHSLGKMPFHKGYGKSGGAIVEHRSVIDFNKSNGKKFHEIETLWGESFIDFHHGLLSQAFAGAENFIFDASPWFARSSGKAKDYYTKYVSLFVLHAILFENFVVEGEDYEFTKDVFLPAFFHAWRTFGVKPLIVALMPTNIEGDVFWVSHPEDTIAHIDRKLLPGSML
jgi:hypothetical protein